jgi:hypothetical protein
MRKANRFIGAVGLGLISLAGCDAVQRWGKANNDLVQEALPEVSFVALLNNGRVTCAVSVQQTSLSLQEVLRRLNLPVTVTEDPSGAVRISSSTPDGARFSLVVTSLSLPSAQPGTPQAQTHVALEWESGADSKKGLQFLLDVAVANRRGEGSAQK